MVMLSSFFAYYYIVEENPCFPVIKVRVSLPVTWNVVHRIRHCRKKRGGGKVGGCFEHFQTYKQAIQVFL